MGKRTHGPHLLNAIDSNDHKKVHDILAIQIKNKMKIHEILTAEIKRLASEYYDCPLLVAACIPDPTLLKYFISKHGIDPNWTQTRGVGKRVKLTPILILAVKRGVYQNVQALLTLNADPNVADHKGRGPLYHAVRRANCRMAKMLLQKGAKSNMADTFGNTPLHTATRFGHVELVKLLMRYQGDLYKTDQSGAIPIHIAAKEGHVPLIQLFCMADVNVNTKIPCNADRREVTPLHVAAEEGHGEMVLALLEQFGAEVNATDSEGETPLHCCVIKEYDEFGMKSKDDYLDTVKILIKFGADPNLANGRGETPLHHAARNEFQKIVELLLVVGADASIEDNDRNKPIDLVSDEDTVSKLALKRAQTNREKLMSNFMEMRARGISGSITSVPGYQGSMSDVSLGNPGGSLLRGRSMSNPGLLDGMDKASLIYDQGYLMPLGGMGGSHIGSMTSLNSAAQMAMNMNVNAMNMSLNRMNVNGVLGLPPRGVCRQASSGSFVSQATVPGAIYASMGSESPYARIDSDSASIVSEGAPQFGQRFGGSARWDQAGRRKKSLEQLIRQRAYNDMSSDSSQQDDSGGTRFRRSRSMSAERGRMMNMPPEGNAFPPLSSTPTKPPVGVLPHRRLNLEQNHLSNAPQSPTSPTESQQSFHSARRSSGSASPKRSSLNSNQSGKHSQGSSPKVQEGNNSSFGNPYGVASSLKQVRDTAPVNVSSVMPEDQDASHVVSEQQNKDVNDEEENVYANMPGEYEEEGVYENEPDACTTPNNTQERVEEVNAQIRSKNKKAINTLLTNLLNQKSQVLPNGIQGVMSDSDDTFFDDESFDTLSDFNVLDSVPMLPEKSAEVKTMQAKPLPLKRPSVPPPPSPTKVSNKVNDPKLETWLAEQATIIEDRQSKMKAENNNEFMEGSLVHSVLLGNVVNAEPIKSVSETHSNSDDEKMNTVIRRKNVAPRSDENHSKGSPVSSTEQSPVHVEKVEKKSKKSKKKNKDSDAKGKGKKRHSHEKFVINGQPEPLPSPQSPKSPKSLSPHLPPEDSVKYSATSRVGNTVNQMESQRQSPLPKPKLAPKPKPRKMTRKQLQQPKEDEEQGQHDLQQQQSIVEQLKYELDMKQQEKMKLQEQSLQKPKEEAVYVNHGTVLGESNALHYQPSVEEIINQSTSLEDSQEPSLQWDDMEGPLFQNATPRSSRSSGAAVQGETEYMEMKDCIPGGGDKEEAGVHPVPDRVPPIPDSVPPVPDSIPPIPDSIPPIPNSTHVLAASYALERNVTQGNNLVVKMREKDKKAPSSVGPRHSFTNAKYVAVPGADELSTRLSAMQDGRYPENYDFDENKNCDSKGEAAVRERRASESDVIDVEGKLATVGPMTPVLNVEKYQLKPAQVDQPSTCVVEKSRATCDAGQPGGPDEAIAGQMHVRVNKPDQRGSDSSSFSTASGPIHRSSPVDHTQQPKGGRVDQYEETASPKRRVTIGAEEVIPPPPKPSKDDDHRRIIYSAGGKMKITVIGGNADGIFVHHIEPGSDAEVKGLRVGDQILKVNNRNLKGKTKEEAVLMIMQYRNKVDLLVRYKKDKYDWLVENGSMGDAFFVKALFNYTPARTGEMKISKGDVFSVRDTMPENRMGSWRALKVNAKPNESQHGLIPNTARAEQVSLAEKRKLELGIDKEQKGGFFRRSMRRAKSAERLDKENRSLLKVMPPLVGEIKAYERVEQKPSGFIRPVVLLGLFCDTVRERLLKDCPGLFEATPPEVELPRRETEGGARVPLNLDIIQGIADRNKHSLMIISPKAISYLHEANMFPIVIYLSPGSKSVVKALRTKLAPDTDRKSSFMFDEAVHFEKAHSNLFTATVTYTVDDSWYTLLRDTIGRFQNQPLWQPKPPVEEDNEDTEYPEVSPQAVSKRKAFTTTANGPPMLKPFSKSRSNQSPTSQERSPIPEQIRNALLRHNNDSIMTADADVSVESETAEICINKPKNTGLTYDGYFLSDHSVSPERDASGTINILGYINGGTYDDMAIEKPRGILKKSKLSQSSHDGEALGTKRRSGSEPDLNTSPLIPNSQSTFTRKGRVNFNTTEVSFKEKQDLIRQRALEEQRLLDQEALERKAKLEEQADEQDKLHEQQIALEEQQMRERLAMSQENAAHTQKAMQKSQSPQLSIQQEIFMQHVLSQPHQQRGPQMQRHLVRRRGPPVQTNPQCIETDL